MTKKTAPFIGQMRTLHIVLVGPGIDRNPPMQTRACPRIAANMSGGGILEVEEMLNLDNA